MMAMRSGRRVARVTALAVVAGLAGAGLAGVGPARARVVHVSAPAGTLAGLLAAAGVGDTLLVGPGRYLGCLRVPDGVAVIAVAGPDSTILDGGGAGPVVTFEQVGAATLLEGFTITGGLLSGEHEDGAGICCVRDASPRLNRNRIAGNRALGADGRGGGIACLDGSHPVVANSRIEDNEAAVGGGVYIGKRSGWVSSPVVGNCAILGNRARRRGGGIAITQACEPVITMNVVAWNVALAGGGGVSVERGLPRIAENVVWANTDSSGTAAGLLLADYAAPTVERNIVAANQGGPGVSCETAQFQEWQAMRCNDVWGHAAGDFSPGCTVYPGNLSVDPEFCDPGSRDPGGEGFRLRPNSPCLAAEGCGQIGAFGPGCGP
jgi:hypothetical protein